MKMLRNVNKINELFALVGGIIIFIVGLLISYDVLSRQLFSKPISWNYDVTRYLLLCISLFPVAYAFQGNTHIKIEIFKNKLSGKLGRLTDISANILTLMLTSALFVLAGSHFYTDLSSNKKTFGSVSIPTSWLTFIVTITMLLLTLTVLKKLRDTVK